MSMVIKLLRILFFLILYFFLCIVLVTTVLQGWPDGAQMLFAFATPIVLVWWGERRRAKKRIQSSVEDRPREEIETGSRLTPENARRERALQERNRAALDPKESPHPNKTHKRTPKQIYAEKRRKERLLSRSKGSDISSTDRAVSQRENNQTYKSERYVPPKQNYTEIVKAVNESPTIQSRKAYRQKRQQELDASQQEYLAQKRGRMARTPSGWVPSGESAIVAGRDIGGMIYVGTPPRLNDYGYHDKCRAYIDPSLSVRSQVRDIEGLEMPYWPGYSNIPAYCRATYLDWLASGRNDPSYDPGYMFLYFYGLERRFILDQPSETEKQEILQEVRRLIDLYPDNGSVQRYLGEFIQLAQISLNDAALHEPVFDYRGWELPLSLKIAIGARVGRGDLLSADWVLSWFMCHPERRLRTPATRCADEFHALFRLRFEERFPEGLKVTKPRKLLKATYRAASGEFEGQVEPLVNDAEASRISGVPDISGVRKPIEIAQEIADEVMDDLDKLSRYLGRNPDARGSVEAQALLPQELWDLFPSEELEQLKTWAGDVVGGGGVIPVLDVIERLEGTRPDKLSKRILTGAADALARIGYGFAPDPRFALRSPKPGEPVVIFELGEAVAKLEEVSGDYRAALIEAALGSFVAHADGQITASEREALYAKAKATKGLSQQEHQRLAANVNWMLNVAPDMTLLRRKLKDTGPEAIVSVRSALIAAAHADGVIQSKEVAGIEKVYKALGLDPALVYSDIHAGGVIDGPVRVRSAQPGAAGEAIPDEAPSGMPKLNAARIAAIQSDTARVSTVLGEIFDETPEEPESAEPDAAQLSGLDAAHSRLVGALIKHDHWTEEAFDELCRASGLLTSGALEAVNEWAFEAYDEALLDEYDGYEVSPDLAEQLKQKFEKEVPNVEA